MAKVARVTKREPRGLRRLGASALAALVAVTSAPEASADLGAIHPEVVKAAAAVNRARGPEAYAALRELWRTWDRGDPAHVEEALAAYAESATTPAPVRVYTEILLAYARRRRGDLDGALAKIEKLGFIGQWVTVGPFDNENKGGFALPYPPELEMNEPIPQSRTYDGKERPVRWRLPPGAAPYGWFDFGELMRPRENICAYATTFVRVKPAAAGRTAPAAARPLTLWMGASGAFKVFWNGESVLEDEGYRDLDIDRYATPVTLRPGQNRITVKVCGGQDEAPKFALRLGDEAGAPATGLEISPSADAGELAGASRAGASKDGAPKAAAAKAKAQPARTQTVFGPMQSLGRAASDPKAKPEALEAFARYLAITGGDAKPEHKARDLASRAADAAPTVRRLLLAGDLAEDRNQEREWVQRAAKLAGPGDLDVLLAQARLAATSVNWRDAVPLYERILAVDPDHTGGVLGLVDLYIEAGLSRTALQALERAISRQPRSVALLRAYAGQLRGLGRDTEAAEVEARYAALRFDDSSFLSSQVDLAVARRDKQGAERWLERFLRSESDSAWSRAVAARTYRALGQRDRALAAYQQALAMAPEDVGTLRALSDIYGEEDNREEQLKLLRQILAISPQAKDVREYVEHIEPPRPRADEAYAWAPERFLPLRADTSKPRYPQRTLRNLTVTTVFPNGLSSSFRQIVFQPLTDEAAANGRQYAFAFQGDRQTVALRAAKVFRANGKIDEAIESGEGGANDPSVAMYTSQRTFYVSFPRLQAGDVVELRYRIEDVAPRNEIADYFGEIEYLQSDEPTANREYVLITPKARTFYFHASPLPGLVRDVKEDGDRRIYRFSAAEVPPIAPEPAMPAWAGLLAHIHVSTFKTWDQVGQWYWGLARDQFDVDDEVRKKVREITKGLTDERSKVRAIYKYATETRYVALEFGIEGIRPRRSAQTLARGWGDCKDKATLIVSMLREVGIPSTIVLLRTRLRGDIEDEPASLAPFDHAIAYVPSLDLYLDGTAEHTGSTELPVMDRWAVGLQINEGKAKLVRLPQPPPEESVVRRKIDVALAADGSAQFGVDVQVTGAFAPSYRQRYMAEGTRRDRVTGDIADELGSVELSAGKQGVEVNNLEDIEQPVKLRAHGKAASFARREGDSLSLPAGPPQHLAAEYASLSTRTLDVVLPALTMREEEWVVRVPQGMKVTRTPIPLERHMPFGDFAITVEQGKGVVTVKSSLALRKARITPAEYAAWRVFCESVDRAFGQRIVVEK